MGVSSDSRYEARRTQTSHASLNLQFDDGDVDHEDFDDLEDGDDDDDSGLFYLYLSRKLSPTVEDSLANGFRFLMDFWFSAFSERLQKARQAEDRCCLLYTSPSPRDS